MEDRLRRREDVGAQLGVDAVGGDHDVGLGGGAVGEADAGYVAVLLEADGAVAGVDDARRAGWRRGSSTKSARCMPKVAFQPEASVTCTGAIGVPSWRK